MEVVHCGTSDRLIHRMLVQLDKTWQPDKMVEAYRMQSLQVLVLRMHELVVVQLERWTMQMQLVEK